MHTIQDMSNQSAVTRWHACMHLMEGNRGPHRIHNKSLLTDVFLDNDQAILFETALAPLQQLKKIICIHKQESISIQQHCHKR